MLAHLCRFGLDRFVADSPDGYVSKALAAGDDPAGPASVRARLRPRMQADIATDPVRAARALEDLVLDLWRQKQG